MGKWLGKWLTILWLVISKFDGWVLIGMGSYWNEYGSGSGVARAFPGGRLVHPENQNVEENK